MDTLAQPPLHKTKAWQHQIKAYNFAMNGRGIMLPLKMGRGKTLVAISVLVNSQAKTTLIIGPAMALGVWPREFLYHSPVDVKVIVLNKGNTIQKVRLAHDALIMAKARGESVAVVVNYETAIRPEFSMWALSKLWDLIILDESHRAKNPKGSTGKLVGKLGHVAKKKLCLSGTPMPHSPLDIFSQYRFLDPNIYGYSFVKFRQMYAKMNAMFPSKVDAWINQEEFNEKFSRIAFYDDGSGGPELPASTDQEITCELSPQAMRVYRELEEILISEIESGLVTADNALVKILRLQQATSGFAVTEDGVVQEIDNAKEMLLTNLLDDIGADEPVVVFCRFTQDLVVIKRVAESLGRVYGEISGRRHDLTDHATMPEWVNVMGVQIQSGGTGIDLTEARYGIYYSLGFSLGDLDQSQARILRPGQKRTVHYYRILAEGTIDRSVYGALAKRRDLVEGVVESLKIQRSAKAS